MVSVGVNQTADWYDAAIDGTLLSSASLSFTPADEGTYFVEARDTFTNCVSERVAIVLDIHPIPSFIVDDNSCADDLVTYSVTITVNEANVVTSDQGIIADNGDGTFTINNIPAGIDVQVSLENSTTTCTFSDTVIASDCACPSINEPTGLMDISICDGEEIPTFTAIVGADEIVDWYDAATEGTLILQGSSSFTPTSSGTFFAETRNNINQYCVDNLAKFKWPRSIDFTTDMPRDPNGKLYKRKLRDPYWKDHGAAV